MSHSRNGLKPEHVLIHVVRPALDALDMGGASAEQLLMGTAAQESNFRYLSQLAYPDTGKRGPALGLWQMEPATHNDIWANYLRFRHLIAKVVSQMGGGDSDELAWNLQYAAAMARLQYRRAPAPLPEAGDSEGMARYWKRWYNTLEGAGNPEEFLANWHRFELPGLWA